MDYPLKWNKESYVGLTIFPSISDCCAAIEANGRSCKVIDDCAAEEDVNDIYNDHCGQKWHMDLERTWGCSNSNDFPDDWWYQENVEQMLHDTPESCCNEIFGNPDCEITDECATEIDNPCTSPVWHYDSENHLCTNHGNYPMIWESEEAKYLCQTHEECCEKNASWSGRHCIVHDFCNEWNEVVGRD